MNVYDKYEAVIGLECHVQLLTETKMYSNDVNEYGGIPNTFVSVVTLGHPGTLPVVNKRAVEFAIRLGIAVNANIREENQFARKNYFYADLPKGYQITQDKTPICTGGYVTIRMENGVEKNIELTRIHMEEDAGKSMHDIDPFDSLIDLNRAGTPLLEIVTEPVMRTGEEAYAYLSEIRKLVRYIGICDGNMEEGSLRCDANISVRLKGEKGFGKKVEVKNMNSFRNVQRAIDFEIHRQIDIIEAGGKIDSETRGFNAVEGETRFLRGKESANDYRYFPEPDLLPVFVTKKDIERVREQLPELPHVLYKRLTNEYKLSDYDAAQITESRDVATYYNEMLRYTSNFKSAANWLMGPIRSWLNEGAMTFQDFKLPAERIAQLIHLIDDGKVSNTAASQTLFPRMMAEPGKTPMELATELDLIQNSDTNELQRLVDDVLSKFGPKVEEYKNGKTGLLGLFVGEVMKQSKGKADPRKLSEIVKATLEK